MLIDKNTMVRAIKTEFRKQIDEREEYRKLSREFNTKPYLEKLLLEEEPGYWLLPAGDFTAPRCCEG
ncbi:MAG: hypothetical protein ACK5HT_20890 [Draconibacterium sp.]